MIATAATARVPVPVPPLAYTPEVARATRLLVDQTAEETRKLGMYGPPVAVPAEASDLDHALGASGRDPRWGG